VEHLTVAYGEKKVLSDISFAVAPHTRTAIIGPTGAGKTQLLYALTGLLHPQSGKAQYDSIAIEKYKKSLLHTQIGIVFQDSSVFNLTVRENIAFSSTVQDEDLKKAIETAELDEFITGLPEGLNTVISERGTTLSGGQKQRLMLARALAINPKILLLDDFTARVDAQTEQKILANVARNYPDITLISVTQKINAVTDYDQIIVLMDGEILARGTHAELLASSPEYIQIYNSQQSMSAYELRT
jgi:ATP-binding cassette subfamily B protein